MAVHDSWLCGCMTNGPVGAITHGCVGAWLMAMWVTHGHRCLSIFCHPPTLLLLLLLQVPQGQRISGLTGLDRRLLQVGYRLGYRELKPCR